MYTIVIAAALGMLQIEGASDKYCEATLKATALGLETVESPLSEQSVKVGSAGQVALGSPRVGYFTFVGRGKADAPPEAVSVLFLPIANSVCFKMVTQQAAIVKASDPEGLVQKFIGGLSTVDQSAVATVWKANLAGVVLSTPTALIYCSLTIANAAFAVSCISSVAQLGASVGFAYLQAARQVMQTNGLLTKDESERLSTILNGASLGVGVGIATIGGVFDGKTLAGALFDKKHLLKVADVANKEVIENKDQKVVASAAVGLVSKSLTVYSILKK